MPTRSPRSIGILLTGTGFSIAAIAGLLLATQANALGLAGLLAGGLVAFVLAGIPLLAGLYLYARSTTAEQELNAEMIKQRELMDALRQHARTTLNALAQQTGISPAEAHDILADLGRLRIFAGYLTPDGQVQPLEGAVLLALRHCPHCQAPLPQAASPTRCAACGTAIFTPDPSASPQN